MLGLGSSTVGRALRNDPHVLPETRARVLAAARKSGYQSNALVNALMVNVRRRKRALPTGEVIAYLTTFPDEDGWRRHPSHLEQFEGAQERARVLGFDLQHFWLGDNGRDSRQVARVLRARGVRGSLLAPVFNVNHHVIELDWSLHAVVTIGYSFQQIMLHRAAHDHISIVAACYAGLREAGCERIGIAMHQLDSARVRHLWITGFLGAQWQLKGYPIPPLIFDDYQDPSPFFRWLDKHRPDAVISTWHDHPLDWLRERGVIVPDEISYATLDVGDRQGRIAGVRQNNKGVGETAMDLLAGQLFRNEIGVPMTPAMMQVEGVWVGGPTIISRPAFSQKL